MVEGAGFNQWFRVLVVLHGQSWLGANLTMDPRNTKSTGILV